VTIARALSNTFAGIRPADVVPFIIAQLVGAVCGLYVCRSLTANSPGAAAQARVSAE
jgi:glycerol uptake facilitator-like aquaporin